MIVALSTACRVVKYSQYNMCTSRERYMEIEPKDSFDRDSSCLVKHNHIAADHNGATSTRNHSNSEIIWNGDLVTGQA